MRRALLLLALASLAAPGAGGAGGATKTIGTRGSVDSISADGGRVAIHAELGANPTCDSGGVWQPTTGKVVRLQDAVCGGKGSSDREYSALTLAGSHVAWVDYDLGNHAYCYGPFAATLAKPKPVDIGNYCDGTPDTSGTYYEFAGDGNLLVARSYLQCEADCDPDYSRTYQTDVEILRVAGGKLTKLLSAQDDTKLLDVAAGRILLLEPPATLVVLDGAGKARGRIVLSKGAIATARLDGSSQVVVAAGTTLTTYDVATGAVVKTATMKAGARFQDVDTGRAVYFAGGAIHVLTIATRRDRVVAKQKGLVQADLEPAGLFYAYNVPGGGPKPGRVTFVPAAALPM